jgi:hypothetical protein
MRFERNNLNCENNLILFLQNLKKTPARSTFKNIPTLEYLLAINWGKGTLNIGTAMKKGIGTYAILPVSYLFLCSSCHAGRPIYVTLQEF